MNIDLLQLKKVTDRLLDHIIETRGIKNIDLQEVHYWNIPFDSVYNVDTNPKNMDIGSLNDDWEFVSSILDDDAQPVAYQLTELAPLIRYLGEVLGTRLAKEGG